MTSKTTNVLNVPILNYLAKYEASHSNERLNTSLAGHLFSKSDCPKTHDRLVMTCLRNWRSLNLSDVIFKGEQYSGFSWSRLVDVGLWWCDLLRDGSCWYKSSAFRPRLLLTILKFLQKVRSMYQALSGDLVPASWISWTYWVGTKMPRFFFFLSLTLYTLSHRIPFKNFLTFSLKFSVKQLIWGRQRLFAGIMPSPALFSQLCTVPPIAQSSEHKNIFLHCSNLVSPFFRRYFT